MALFRANDARIVIVVDLDLLQTFSAVARRGSFAAVARDEGVDPSSVSRRVAALESALELSLFERTTRRLRLTESGRLYLDRIRPVLDGLAEAADVARDAMTVPSGRLRVTASVAFGERWLMPRIAAFRTDYPHIELELLLTDARLDIAAEGIDLALRLGPRIEGALVAAKLFDTRYRAVAAPAYLARVAPVSSPHDLTALDSIVFALPRFGSAWKFRTSRTAPVDVVNPRPVLTITNALAIRRAALEGLGVSLLADWTVAQDLETGRLVDLLPRYEGSATDFDSAVWLAYPSRDCVPARLRAFIDHLRASTPSESRSTTQ